MRVKVTAPASSANLGPGFDCLALALDLFNETSVATDAEAISITVTGEGAAALNGARGSLILNAMQRLYGEVKQPFPRGLRLECANGIPLGSGLGSSACAAVSGLTVANALLGSPLSPQKLLRLAFELEGHADNAAASLLGGMTLTIVEDGKPLARRLELPALDWQIVVVLPAVTLSTRRARSVLPLQVPLQDAVFNASRAALLVDALRGADFDAFRLAMTDRLHQPYRLGLIPGARSALHTAQDMGAAAALSGAGPSLIAFCRTGVQEVAAAMRACFEREGVSARLFFPRIALDGARVEIIP